ncbi:FxSxx-COOH system tetratricopeptide repeat protein [Saccharothrix algeriensis]|uniref:Mrp family chromosome partitioning ATPase/tetratricopeptide (TPR) repeat protein n=1 Tax=Saccharothrix algeriensis TaxID=173560 RepID=A0A8T8HX52_9PSEU|nr:FxSxx-COOH system tetratricopeptide repeat protein [Saccharothrix algeriensis]MBM7813957.1 Mrp family chromosome partitioning ATPase/tetratricopeptide (TPR) repeat protein [Saccharothrix algeriensis]QTR02374.1 NTPase [Saccharothrix algeriensis]
MSSTAGHGHTGVTAFLSATGGTGRTSAVANLAWVLAGAGQRVLVVDWGSEVPRVREYLEPFLVSRQALPDALGRALLAAYLAEPFRDEGPPPVVERFALPVPGSAGRIDVVVPMSADTAGRPRHGDAGAVAELRARLAESEYDQVLIDAPTGVAEGSLALVATLCELAVVCFRPRPRAIADAADLAARVRKRAPIRIDVVPVATLFDDAEQTRAQRIRSQIHAAFAELLAGQAKRVPDGGAVEIPYRPLDAFDPLLAILAEEEGGGLEAQYGRLAAAVSGGAVAVCPPVPPVLRARYRRVFGLEAGSEADRVAVVHAPRDRAWADWVRGQLERAGAQVVPLRDVARGGPAAGVVVLVSPHLGPVEVPAGVAVLRLLLTGDGDPDGLSVHEHLPEALSARLLGHFGLIDRPGTAHDAPMRLPGTDPEVFRLPPRHRAFVGRDEDIEALRDEFADAGDERAVVTLNGEPGVGKSELALEYAYRFSADYDAVWWLSAQDRQSVQVGLAELAARLRLPGSTDYGSLSVLDRLATDPAYARFLLVYDNADDLDSIADLLPPGSTGHVLITSSAAAAPAVELAPMGAADSVALLLDRVRGLEPADARRVAAEVGRLPLALDLAASWLAEAVRAERGAGSSDADSAAWAVRTFFDRLERSGVDGAARVVDVVVGSLREQPIGRVAVLLAQLCSFLSAQGVALGLVRSPAFLGRLVAAGGPDAAPLELDAGEVDRVLWAGARHGLFRVDWGDQFSLRLHRVVQRALRDGMPPSERARRRADVLAALAAYAPTEVEDKSPTRRTRFQELQQHVFPSGAVRSADPAVRRWLVNQVRFLFTDGGAGVRRAALEPGRELLDSWTDRFGAADPLRNRLAAQLANVHRVLGEPAEALRLDDLALAQQRRALDLTHPQPLITARGRGGDLRGLGLFTEALVEDQATWEGLRSVLGEDHPDTRRAANNLASSTFLSGDAAGALGLEEDNFRRRRRLFGERDEFTWVTLAQIGLYQRELGRYPEALESLLTASQKLQSLRPELNQTQVGVHWNYAIALRLAGRTRAAKERTGKALRDYRELIGPDHPYTLGCALSFAADHRRVGGDPELAVELARTALTGFERLAGIRADHPFTALCRLGLGLALRAAGDRAGAVEEVSAAARALRSRLGDTHPWTLAAAVDEARVRAAAGEVDQAAVLIAEAHADCVEFLGPDHPHTAVAAHDLRVAARPGDDDWQECDVDVPHT